MVRNSLQTELCDGNYDAFKRSQVINRVSHDGPDNLASFIGKVGLWKRTPLCTKNRGHNNIFP